MIQIPRHTILHLNFPWKESCTSVTGGLSHYLYRLLCILHGAGFLPIVVYQFDSLLWVLGFHWISYIPVVFFFSTVWVPISLGSSESQEPPGQIQVGQCSLLKRGWLFDIGMKILPDLYGGFSNLQANIRITRNQAVFTWHVSQGFCMLPLPRCRSNPNEVDLSFCGSQWLLSSQAYCRRDLPWHDKTSSCRKFQLYSPRRQVIASGCIWNPLLHPTYLKYHEIPVQMMCFPWLCLFNHLLQRVTHPKWNYPLV